MVYIILTVFTFIAFYFSVRGDVPATLRISFNEP